MNEQPSLTHEEAPGAESDHPPASVASRTAIGVALVAILAGLLWVDHAGPQRWLPGWTEGLTGLHGLLEHGLLMALVVAVVAAVTLREFALLARRRGAEVPCALLVVCGLALVLLQWPGWAFTGGKFLVCPVPLQSPGLTAAAILCGGTLLVLVYRAVAGRIEGSLETAGAFALGLAYIALAFGFMGGIRVRWGVPGVVSVLAVCKFTDIGAYYAGTLIGGPRLAPRVSPRKTWAGVAGGMVAAVAVSLVLSAIGLIGLTLPLAALYGLLLGPVAVLGDLIESLLKRQAGVKDSGNLLHGYGGIWDMVDDVLLALPFSYVFFSLTLAGGQG